MEALKGMNVTGNAYRVNDLAIADKPITLFIHDEHYIGLCARLEGEFRGKIPFGYIGTSPWLGGKINPKDFKKDDPINLKIHETLFAYGEVGIVFYAFEGEERDAVERYLKWMKDKLPKAQHIMIQVVDQTQEVHNVAKELGFEALCIKQKDDINSVVDVVEARISNMTTSMPRYELEWEFAEWNNFSFENIDDKEQPRILIVGDSISFGYGGKVRQQLAEYNVDTLNTSAGIQPPILNNLLACALSQFEYEKIHINIGIHTHGITNEAYENYLSELIDEIRNQSPHVQIIFATTTTVSKKPEATMPSEKTDANTFTLGHRNPVDNTIKLEYSVYDQEGSQRYIELNEIAAKVCKEKKVEIDDLFDVSYRHNPVKNDSVHFREDGYKLLADSAVRSIRKKQI